MASSDNRIWCVSFNSARSWGTDQWRANRRWPSQHNTSQPIHQRGMLIESSASGLKVRPRLWHEMSGQRTRRLTTWVGPANVQENDTGGRKHAYNGRRLGTSDPQLP